MTVSFRLVSLLSITVVALSACTTFADPISDPSASAGAGRSGAATAASQVTTVLAVGDSTTFTPSLPDPLLDAWPGLLQKRAGRQDLVINAGQSGNCLVRWDCSGKPVVARLPELLDQYEGTDVVIVAAGGEDLRLGASRLDIISGMQTLHDTLAGRGVDLYVTTIPPWAGSGRRFARRQAIRVSINKWMTRRYPSRLLDFSGALSSSKGEIRQGVLSKRGVEPTVTGHMRLANAIPNTVLHASRRHG